MILSICCALSSCNRYGNTSNYLQGEVLNLSLDSVKILHPYGLSHKEALDYFNSNGEYFLFCYIDSTMCSDCQIKNLIKYRIMTESIAKDVKHDVKTIIYLSATTKLLNKIEYNYYNTIPSFPIAIDTLDIFSRNNSWISEEGSRKLILLDDKFKIKQVY